MKLIISSLFLLSNLCFALNGVIKFPLEFRRNEYFQGFDYFDQGHYYTKLGVGTPPQTVEVAFEPAQEGVTTILEANCFNFDDMLDHTNYKQQPCAKNDFTFEPKNSTTCEKTGRLADLRETKSAFGEWIFDNFVLGDPSDKQNSMPLKNKVEFASGRYTLSSDYPIIGLAMNDSAPRSHLFYLGWKEGLVKKPVYSIYQKRCGSNLCKNAGSIVLGCEDFENCEPVKVNYPIIRNESSVYFDPTIQFNSAQIVDQNNKVLELNDNKPIKANLNIQYSMLMLPMKDAKKIFEFLNVKLNNTEVGENEKEKALPPSLPCNTKFDFKINLPSETLNIKSENFMIRQDPKNPENCFFNVVGIEQATPEEEIVWSIGNQITMDYCTVYDMEKKTIGFGKVKSF